MVDIVIEKCDETYVRLKIENAGIEQELADVFTFDAQNIKFHPKFKKKQWDGKIRLYNKHTRKILAGLSPRIIEFARSKNYTVQNKTEFTTEIDISADIVKEFLKDLNLPAKYEIRDYQLKTFLFAIRNRRALLLSPTASGKSLIAYLISEFFLTYLPQPRKNVLIIVPTINLVQQFSKDINDYGYKETVIEIMEGKYKSNYGLSGPTTRTKAIWIATWQSVFNEPESFFDQFDMIIGDEAHGFKANSLVKLMESAKNVKYRFGMSGSLDDKEVHHLTLEGLFGKKFQSATTKELQAQKFLSDLKINILVLKHSPAKTRPLARDYQAEVSYIVSNKDRNLFIARLVASLSGKTLVLYSRVDTHGQVLFDMIKNVKELSGDIGSTFFIHGGVSAQNRENVRNYMIASLGKVDLVASYGTFSTGVNIPNIDNMVFASGSKSRIRVLQSLGRGLRIAGAKEYCKLYDITDHFGYPKNNYSINHMIERIKIYNEEEFEYKIHTIKLRDEGENILF